MKQTAINPDFIKDNKRPEGFNRIPPVGINKASFNGDTYSWSSDSGGWFRDTTVNDKQPIYTVTNIDDVVKTFKTDEELLAYVQLIYKENEDGNPYPSEIHWLPENVQQAKEYIHEYCSNLTLDENPNDKQEQTEGFTPGEWKAGTSLYDAHSNIFKAPVMVNTDQWVAHGYGSSYLEAEANARLIASAPTLYRDNKELKKALKGFEAVLLDGDPGKISDYWFSVKNMTE